jgi:hypothetical protein
VRGGLAVRCCRGFRGEGAVSRFIAGRGVWGPEAEDRGGGEAGLARRGRIEVVGGVGHDAAEDAEGLEAGEGECVVEREGRGMGRDGDHEGVSGEVWRIHAG